MSSEIGIWMVGITDGIRFKIACTKNMRKSKPYLLSLTSSYTEIVEPERSVTHNAMMFEFCSSKRLA